ncbi:hypothetical protein HYALB_00005495 [Hymenoscyphus albidus]|uniref:Mitochondrial carrier n=1 Tax=Hymenoscyphus albidus TaxID=595503 RepID=A0A9N9M463_9HELO|nr:hypothetical protein HYALB_00005495 [Hymenoscyphus albidus]
MSKNTHTDVLLAGAFAAFSVDLLVYPLDTLKTRLQSQDYQKIYIDASKNAINRRLLFSGLYQGVGSIILITIPSSGAFFTTYEAVKSGFNKINPTRNDSSSPLFPQPLVHSAASSIAELVSCFILTPAEVLKQNAQMIRKPSTESSSKSSTVFRSSATIQTLKRFKNPSKLWIGYTALAARNLPFTAMQFPMFEHMKESIKQYRKDKGIFTGSLIETSITTAVSAGSAGSIAAIITTPIDVVKTRIMLSAASEKETIENIQNVKDQPPEKQAQMRGSSKKSGLVVGRDIFKDQGMKGLFRGGTLRAAWTALGSGLYLGVYETGRVWLGDRHESTGGNDL